MTLKEYISSRVGAQFYVVASVFSVAIIVVAWALSYKSSCTQESDVRQRFVSVVDSAYAKGDRELALMALDQVRALTQTQQQSDVLSVYAFLLEEKEHTPEQIEAQIRTAHSSLDDSRRSKRALMRLLEAYAESIERSVSRDVVEDLRCRVAALAYELGCNDVYVRQRVMMYCQEELLGNYGEAISGYRESLDFCKRNGVTSEQNVILHRLAESFIIMGDLPMAKYYLEEIEDFSSNKDTLSHYWLQALWARYYVSVPDTANIKTSLESVEALLRVPEVRRASLSYLESLRAELYLVTGNMDSASAVINRLEYLCKVGRSVPAINPSYPKLLKAKVALAMGDSPKAKSLLDEIDGDALRHSDVLLYEWYANVRIAYCASVRDYYDAYQYARIKSTMVDSLRREAVGHNFAYKSLTHRLDTTIVRQERDIDILKSEKKSLLTMRVVWVVVGVIFIALGFVIYYVWMVTGVRRRSNMMEAMRCRLVYDVEERKSQLDWQMKMLNDKNESLIAGMNFARKVQDNTLPSESMLDFDGIDDHFVLSEPCFIIGGDFYWFHETNGRLFVCEGDATGHGVPGAMLSMAASTILSDLVNRDSTHSPAELVQSLSDSLMDMLRGNEKIDNKDSVDLAMLCVDKVSQKVTLCLARQIAYIAHADGSITRVTGTKRSVAEPKDAYAPAPFSDKVLNLAPGDCIYLASDGFESQFGGPQDKKLKRKGLERMLADVHSKPMREQAECLKEMFDVWRADAPQTDDVLLIGLRFAGFDDKKMNA